MPFSVKVDVVIVSTGGRGGINSVVVVVVDVVVVVVVIRSRSQLRTRKLWGHQEGWTGANGLQ